MESSIYSFGLCSKRFAYKQRGTKQNEMRSGGGRGLGGSKRIGSRTLFWLFLAPAYMGVFASSSSFICLIEIIQHFTQKFIIFPISPPFQPPREFRPPSCFAFSVPFPPPVLPGSKGSTVQSAWAIVDCEQSSNFPQIQLASGNE